jgi:hypothetical protein
MRSEAEADKTHGDENFFVLIFDGFLKSRHSGENRSPVPS